MRLQSFHSAPYTLPARIVAFFFNAQRASARQIDFVRDAHAKFTRKYRGRPGTRSCPLEEHALVPLLSYDPHRTDISTGLLLPAFVEIP
jgi:hypothetical protein